MKKEKIQSFIKAVKNVREAIPDEIALENIDLYPDWLPGKELKSGNRVVYNGKLYKVLQEHTTQTTWNPVDALTLFEPLDIVNEGTVDSPILAAIGMTYYKNKYYFDETDGKKYLCTRDDTNGNGTILHYMPSALVGIYFEVCE